MLILNHNMREDDYINSFTTFLEWSAKYSKAHRWPIQVSNLYANDLDK
jgi:hypothetical protein